MKKRALLVLILASLFAVSAEAETICVKKNAKVNNSKVNLANSIKIADSCGKGFVELLDTSNFKGDKGDKGDKGEQGVQGQAGPAGADGVKGQDGENGAPGEKGIQGDKGDKGDKGDIGPTGATGKDGILNVKSCIKKSCETVKKDADCTCGDGTTEYIDIDGTFSRDIVVAKNPAGAEYKLIPAFKIPETAAELAKACDIECYQCVTKGAENPNKLPICVEGKVNETCGTDGDKPSLTYTGGTGVCVNEYNDYLSKTKYEDEKVANGQYEYMMVDFTSAKLYKDGTEEVDDFKADSAYCSKIKPSSESTTGVYLTQYEIDYCKSSGDISGTEEEMEAKKLNIINDCGNHKGKLTITSQNLSAILNSCNGFKAAKANYTCEKEAADCNDKVTASDKYQYPNGIKMSADGTTKDYIVCCETEARPTATATPTPIVP